MYLNLSIKIYHRCKNNKFRRIKVAIFTFFKKSKQEKITFGDNEASAEVTSRRQQEGDLLQSYAK